MLSTDTSLLRTVFHVPGESISPHIFFKFNPIKTDTSIIRTLSMAPFGVRINGL